MLLAVKALTVLGRIHSWDPALIYWRFSSWQGLRPLGADFILM